MNQRRTILGAGLVGLLGTWITAKRQDTPTGSTCPRTNLVAQVAEPGDLIFMTSTSLTSRFVEALDFDSEFGHVGIVDKVETGTIVLHATPDEDGGGAMRETLESFLYTFRLQHVGLFEVVGASNEQVHRALLHAHQMCNDALRYSDDWTYDFSGPVFCTEFVWRAYHKAGIQLLPDQMNAPGALSWANAFPSQLLKTRPVRRRAISCR